MINLDVSWYLDKEECKGNKHLAFTILELDFVTVN